MSNPSRKNRSKKGDQVHEDSLSIKDGVDELEQKGDGNYVTKAYVYEMMKMQESLFRNLFDSLLTNVNSRIDGFRNNHSTALALIDLINSISPAIDRNETTLGIFLDLSKAFDTINHEILCQKLQHYGIRDTALAWIKSYLDDRTQFVQFGSHRSYPRKILCGVPQGSILGPLFYYLH